MKPLSPVFLHCGIVLEDTQGSGTGSGCAELNMVQLIVCVVALSWFTISECFVSKVQLVGLRIRPAKTVMPV